MAAEMETPTERGIPLPLVPIDDPRMPEGAFNWHHHFHPRTSPLLTDDEGAVIRASRLQKSLAYGNHTEYHQWYEGPHLPQTDEERLGVIILARAGYIPEHGILMRGSRRKPQIVTLNQRQRWLLMDQTQLRSGSIGLTKEYLTKLVLAQDLSTHTSLIDEFLETKDQERKRSIGGFLIGDALHQVISPAAADYLNAWRTGRISHHLPRKPQRFARSILGSPKHRVRLITNLEAKLAA